MICPTCQKENADGAKFCNYCGAALFERPDKLIADSRREIEDLDLPLPPDISDPSFMHRITDATTQVRTPAYSTADLKTNPNLGASAPIPFKGESLAPVVEAMFTRHSDDPSVPATPTWDTSPIDFTGFEQLVDSSYVPPRPQAQTGDTLEMPAVTPPARKGREFRAHASAREEKQRHREEKHQQKALKKAQKREAREAAHAMKKVGAPPAPPAPPAAPQTTEEQPAVTPSPAEGTDTIETTPASSTPLTEAEPASTAPQVESTPPTPSTTEPSSPIDQSSRFPAHASAPIPKPRRSYVWIPIVIGIIVAIAAAIGLTYYFQLWGGKVVPDVVGETEAVGRGQLESAGFTVRIVSVKSDEKPGTVLLTDPNGGARAPEGGEVVMHVSIARTVPNVIGMTRDEAAALLDEDGFNKVEFVSQKSDEPENVVLAVDPAPDTEAKASTLITVTYAEPFVVPDVAGMPAGEAENAIADAGLVASVSYTFTEEVPEGTAISTDPAAGTKVKGGSTVKLSIARSRKAQLIEATASFLAVGSSIRVNSTDYPSGTYVINSLDSVVYDGNDKTTFTITATPYDVSTVWFLLSPEVKYGTPISITGVAQWGTDGSLLTVAPDIARIG